MEAMGNRCDKINIEFTPTFFVSIFNSENVQHSQYYQLPSIYSVDDLKHFLTV